MQKNSDPLQLSQKHETQVQVIQENDLAYRFAYARAKEIQEADDSGQDYLTVLNLKTVLVFALCDGVSQSFMGDLAARYLGDALVEWLKDPSRITTSHKSIRDALDAHLRELTKAATEEVQRYPLPQNIPPMLREVLEQKRKIGSQTTFVCGRIDLPCQEFPNGHLVLAWMGDSRLRVWSKDGTALSLNGNFETAQRWSSNRGPLNGQPNVYVSSLEPTIGRIMAYTDGLSALDDWQESPSNTTVDKLIADAELTPQNDDITFFEIRVGESPTEWSREVVPLPAPEIKAVGVREGSLYLTWKPTAETTHYEIDYNDKHDTTQSVNWKVVNPEPGSYRIRLRAWQKATPGTWSNWQQVTVPEVEGIKAPVSSVPQHSSLSNASFVVVGAGVLTMSLILWAFFSPGGPFHRVIVKEPTPTIAYPVVEAQPSPTVALLPVSVLATSALSPTTVASPTPSLSLTATATLEATMTPSLTPLSTTVLSPIETPAALLSVLDSPLQIPIAPLTITITPLP